MGSSKVIALLSLLVACSSHATPIRVLSVRAAGEHSISKLEHRMITRRLKRRYKQETGVRLLFKRKHIPDYWPETHCPTSQCKFERREHWRAFLASSPYKYKLVLLPFIDDGGNKITGGAADGICTYGLATANIVSGQIEKNSGIAAHELGHLLGASHVVGEAKPTIMNPVYGYVQGTVGGISVAFYNFHFAQDSINQISQCVNLTTKEKEEDGKEQENQS